MRSCRSTNDIVMKRKVIREGQIQSGTEKSKRDSLVTSKMFRRKLIIDDDGKERDLMIKIFHNTSNLTINVATHTVVVYIKCHTSENHLC